MAKGSAEKFFRNYFANYEMEPSRSKKPVKLERDLKDCHCVMKCCSRFSPEVRLQLHAWYQKLSPQGQTAFLSTHLRETSPGENRYRLPTVGAGDLERVCMMHFIDTLQETKERIRSVTLDKRKAFLPEEEQKQDNAMKCEAERKEDFLPDKRYRSGTKGASMLNRVARGMSYTTCRSKRVIPARKVKAPCDSACKIKCYKRFSLDVRQQKLHELLQLPLDKQHKFLTDHVCKMAPIRPKVHSTCKRQNILYFFREGRQLHRVCKVMFLNTYDITRQRFRGLMNQKGANAHEICENPNLEAVLKKYHNKRLVFDVDEGLDGEVSKTALEELDENCFSEEDNELKQEYDEITIEYGTIKKEFDETEEAILPDELSASNVCNEVGPPSSDWIKQENMEVDETPTQDVKWPSVDIKPEMIDPDAEQLLIPLSRRDDFDSVNEDSNYDPGETDEDEGSDTDTSRVGNGHPAPEIKPHCGTKCNMQCYTRISDELRVGLLTNLLQMSSTKQRKYIGDHICVVPSRRYQSRTSRRQFSNFYFLPDKSRLIKVCKLMFCSTFDLKHGQLRKIIREKGDNKHVVCGNPDFSSALNKGCGYYYRNSSDKISENPCKCSLMCPSKISKEVIEGIRTSFQKMTIHEQYDFLSKYVKLPTEKNLFRTRFFLPLESSEDVEVCRKMFIFAFNVSWSFVRVLLGNLESNEDSIDYAEAHIATYRMYEDHTCKVAGGAVRKLAHCPNPLRMFNEYLEELAGQQQQQPQPKAIEYKQYFDLFSKCYSETGSELPTKCLDCGFFSRGEVS